MSDFFNNLPVAVFPLLFFVWFVGLWLAITFCLSYFGGWQTLARHFHDAGDAPETQQRFRRIIVRRTRLLATNYGNVVTLAVDEKALYVRVGRLFRLAHPPLRIPYSEIVTKDVSFLGQHYKILTFPGKTKVQIVMFSKSWDWVSKNVPEGVLA